MNIISEFLQKLDVTEYSLRERLIRRIMLFGTIISFLSVIEVLFFTSTYLTLVPLLLLQLVMITAVVLTYKYRKVELAACIIGVAASMFAFPAIFFLSGGIRGGATVWFILGIFYAIGMFHGKMMILFLGITIASYVATYYVGYLYPEMIIPLKNESEVYNDSLFAVIVVGILLGVVSKYQLRAYDKERKLALDQRDEIERFSDSKNDFFASMSHEIRTPINTIIGLNEMILREEFLSNETRENAIEMQNASKMLLSLVNDILDLSLIESKKMEIENSVYDTKSLFDDLVGMMHMRMKEKKLDFILNIDGDIPTRLYGDDTRIKQVLLNLLTNAIKYTKEGSITFGAQYEKIGEEWCKLIISVADTGIGIKTEQMDGLFDAFQSINFGGSKNVEGTGLGLSISKQLIDLMDGEIKVDSIYTKGTTFTVIIEQKIIDPRAMGPVNFLDNTSKGKTYKHLFEAPEARILVVDDNDMNRLVVSKLLKETKIQIDTAASGEECLEKTKLKNYDAILMDYMMPEMDGKTTLMQVRHQENGLCRNTPVIILSADKMVTTGQRYLEMGFDAMLEKPFRGSQLEQVILNFLPDEILEYRLNIQTKNLDSSDEILLLSEYKKKKISITTDCVCDMSEEMLDRYDVQTMHMYINTEVSRFRDGHEIDADSLSKIMSESDSKAWGESASVEEYENFFAACLVNSEEVIHISVGKGMGKSYDNAIKAAKGFGHVHVIDSGCDSGGMALIVMHAVETLRQGFNVEEIMAEVEKIKKSVVCNFVLPACNIFYENGYTDIITGKVYSLLKLRPKLKTRQSELKICGFYTGEYDFALKRFASSQFRFKKNKIKGTIYITHSGLSVMQLEKFVEELKKYINMENVIIEKSCVTNACFAGIGAVGVAYIADKKKIEQ